VTTTSSCKNDGNGNTDTSDSKSIVGGR
jgi:hypothetical protein